ncbi:MAG: DNA repair protein RecN [Thermoleophilia bacterium]|nr:DNA repair protein RecN [Thermoleophilia bacterium]
MLASLAIRNFILIEDDILDFDAGLNVLTGETGAGKTLLTRALGLLMGERAEEGLVGKNAPEALIQAVFELDEPDIAAVPEDVQTLVGGVAPGELIVTRRLGKEGRNRCFINDTTVTLGAMANAVAGLLSFAGQHEYRRLLDPRYQLSMLDEWAGDDVVELAKTFRGAFEKARDAQRRLEEACRTQESRLRESELLRFQIDELTEAALSLEEESALTAEQRVLSRAEDILRNAGIAAACLNSDGEQPDAGSLIAQAGSQLVSLAGVDSFLDGIGKALSEAQYQVTDLARELHAYMAKVSVDPGRLAAVDERLRRYTDLARKYGGSTAAVLEHQTEAGARLAELEQSEVDLARLEEVRAAETARALRLAESLTEKRRLAVPALEEAVGAQLRDLGMPSASLRVDLRTEAVWERLRESGAESAEFLLVANPGQEPRSLGKTASGGELSRVLLGVKCALAGIGANETLVFDEIDAGIGGRTAVTVANKLRQLAARSQLIVVTHLAQVAALATRHYLVDKSTDAETAVTRLALLTGDEVVRELCRMLGGRPDDAEAMAHARDLRDRAAEGLLD